MEPQQISVFPIGEKNEAYAPYFVGQSYLNMLSLEQVAIGNVTFGPGEYASCCGIPAQR